MSAPAPPTNVTPTVDSNDQITLTWDYDPTWFAFDGDNGGFGGFDEGRWYESSSADHFEIEISRDENGYVSINGGPDTVSYDGSTEYVETYKPDDTAGYYTKVGTGSLFKFRVRAVNSDGASGWTSSTTVTTDLHSASSVNLSVTSNSELSVSWTIEDSNTGGHKIQYRKNGTTTWSTFSDLGASVESEVINSLSQDTTYEVRVNSYTQYTTSQSSVRAATTFLNEGRSISTHSSAADSSSLRNLNLLENAVSHTAPATSSSERVAELFAVAYSTSSAIRGVAERTVDLSESVASEVAKFGSDSAGVIAVDYGIGSHSNNVGSASSRITDVLASTNSHSSSSGSANNRSNVNLSQRNSGGSYLVGADSYTERLTNLVAASVSHLTTSDTSSSRLVSLNASPQSNGSASDSLSLCVVDLSQNVSSYSSSADGGVLAAINVTASPISHSAASDSASGRGDVSYAIRGVGSTLPAAGTDSIRVVNLSKLVESHGKRSQSSVYNDRTSLELLDHNITWKDGEAVWYTDWFQESKILGSEDSLAVRSLVVEGSKEPAATVLLQYDENGNGEVDEESDPVRLGSEQTVEKISGITVNEDGYYRLRISEYSGYNSLYALDTAIIH